MPDSQFEQPQQDVRTYTSQPIPENYLMWFQDFKPEMEELFHRLLGEVGTYDKQEDGSFLPNWKKMYKPVMNERGAHYLVMELRGMALMKTSIMSKIDEKRLMRIIKSNVLALNKTMYSRSTCDELDHPNKCSLACQDVRHLHRCSCFEINMEEINSVLEMVDNLMEFALRSSVGGEYMKLVRGTYGTSESRQVAFTPQEKPKGLIDGLFKMR